MPSCEYTGSYGMNFDFVPGLEWRSGYFIVLGVTAGLAVWMVIYFERPAWM
jgi:magnesium transporter